MITEMVANCDERFNEREVVVDTHRRGWRLWPHPNRGAFGVEEGELPTLRNAAEQPDSFN